MGAPHLGDDENHHVVGDPGQDSVTRNTRFIDQVLDDVFSPEKNYQTKSPMN